MEANLKDNFLVPYDKEFVDSKKLIELVGQANWIEGETVLVNCFPEYSARLTHLTNHKLSIYNNNELFEVIDLQMPYPNMAQVWSTCDRNYQGFHNYLTDWVRSNVFTTCKYLFISAAENLTILRPFIKVKLDSDDFRLASIYIKETDSEPDFFVEKYKGDILFQWENMNNPNKNKTYAKARKEN